MADLESLTRAIERKYSDLTPQMRRAARYIIAAPTDIALYPLREVAKNAEVGATTLIRLANVLGFDSYDALREMFRENFRSGAKRYSNRAKALQAKRPDAQLDKLLRESETALTQQLHDLFQSRSVAELNAAADLVLRARKVCIVAFRSCFAPAFYLYYLTQIFSSNVVLVEDRGGMMVDELGDLGPEDVVIAISFDPYLAETIRVCRYASDRGCSLIAVTDSPVSPLAIGTAHVFLVPTSSTSFYQSLVPTIALLETLVALIVSRGGKDAVERIREGFERREAFGVYWQEND